MDTNTRLFPTSIQDFAKLREGGHVYVDKTVRIHRLISGTPGAFFLSRPRRFGKSLLCSTLGAIFEGKRELFQEYAGQPALAIDSLDWGWKRHPVIRLDLSAGAYLNGVGEIHSVLRTELEREAEKHGVTFVCADDPISRFKYLIQKACENGGEKVAVIIDEYDKPLLDSIGDAGAHALIRGQLKGFYGVLKSYDAYLRFVFITGVTKFARVSLFSDLNHLTDLSLRAEYADICGITQEELLDVFAPEIEAVTSAKGLSREAYIGELRRFYNGYRFSEDPITVYNPYGLLNHFDENGKFRPYWYESATPEFVISLIKEQKIDIANLGGIQVGRESFGRYDVEDMEALPVLCQAGYLTISGYDEKRDRFTLDYPNAEVRTSFAKSLLKHYLRAPREKSDVLIDTLPGALLEGDVAAAMESLRPFLASVPYSLIRDTENYFQTVVHIVFSTFGLDCQSEVKTADGRIDTLVKTDKFVYCFEFKLNKSAKSALAQIDTKEYLLPWTGSGKKLFKVGVSFSSKRKNIVDWKYAVG